MLNKKGLQFSFSITLVIKKITNKKFFLFEITIIIVKNLNVVKVK